MISTTVDQVLRKDPETKKTFLGVFARDKLPEKVSFPSCLVFDTDNQNEPGEHWLALHYNNNGFCNFFDSYGQHPSAYKMVSYLNNTSKKWSYNMKTLQGLSTYCGFYCLFYLLFKSRNKSAEFFKQFTSNVIKNDELIKNEIKKIS